MQGCSIAGVISHKIPNVAKTYRVTWVDIAVIFDSGGFLLHSRVVLLVAVHGLRNERVPDGTDALVKLRVESEGCSEISGTEEKDRR